MISSSALLNTPMNSTESTRKETKADITITLDIPSSNLNQCLWEYSSPNAPKEQIINRGTPIISNITGIACLNLNTSLKYPIVNSIVVANIGSFN